MAACDNLYGNLTQWEELHSFLAKAKPEYLKYMREKPSSDDEEVRICYIADMQSWLDENCPMELDWLKEELQENFDVQRIILGKAHHD